MATEILLVESKENESSAELLLRSQGYSVIRSEDVDDAMARIGVQHIDLVIADIRIPGGAETLVSQLKSSRAMPVIVVSPFNDQFEFDIARCISAGVDDVLSADLMETIMSSRIYSILEKETLRLGQAEHLAEIKRQKDLVETRNQELQQMNDLKNKFIGMAAHDLRNPLASIQGFSDLVLTEDGLEPSERKHFLEIIHSSSTQMLNLVNDLLDVAVIESGNLDLNRAPGMLSEIVRARLEIFHPIAHKKGMNIHANMMDEGTCSIDINRIGQVIDNLISNAIKFSPQGSKVEVTEASGDGFVSVSVKDEGPGLSKEDQESMFQDFKKLSARPTGDEGSTGLGLAIVKRIVEAHDGDIHVASKAGEGSTFTFRIPCGVV